MYRNNLRHPRTSTNIVQGKANAGVAPHHCTVLAHTGIDPVKLDSEGLIGVLAGDGDLVRVANGPARAYILEAGLTKPLTEIVRISDLYAEQYGYSNKYFFS